MRAGGRAARAALRLARRAGLFVLPQLGLQVRQVGSGAYLVHRAGPGPRVRALAGGLLVHGRRARLRIDRVGKQAWVVATAGSTVHGLEPGTSVVTDRGRDVVPVEVVPGSFLVRTSRGRRDTLGTAVHREREKVVTTELIMDHVVGLARLYDVDCFLDVGANEGQFALRLREAGWTGPIVSFEPSPDVYRVLERAAAEDPDWHTSCVALGAADGVLPLHVHPRQTGMSSLLPASDYGRQSPDLLETVLVDVPVRRLEDVLDDVLPAGAGRRLFLKMDTQGFDLEVFAGLGQQAAQVVALQSELSLMPMYEGTPRMPSALERYEAAGFELSGIYTVRRQYRTARMVEADCVMVRPDEARPAGAKP